MKHFTVGPNDAGQRLDRFLAKIAPLLPGTLAQKYIRLKRVRVNGVPGKRDTRLAEGDELAIYIGDEFFNRPDKDNALTGRDMQIDARQRMARSERFGEGVNVDHRR